MGRLVKIFVAMLLLANLAGLAWARLQHPMYVRPPSSLPGPLFIPAKNGLQFLDIAKAQERDSLAPIASVGAEPMVTAVSSFSEDLEAVAVDIGGSEKWCGLSDSFPTEDEAKGWLSAWVAVGGSGITTQFEGPISSTWWVHLSPFPTEAEARVVLVELQGKKIDSFYMRTGALAGGISLGVFSLKERAYLWQADIQKKGYSPVVKEVPRMANLFRVAVELPTKVLLTSLEVEEFLNAKGAAAVREIPCK